MLVTLLCSCAGGPVVEVDPCVEIPFLDAAEGACTNTVTHKAYLVSAADWKKQRPTMIMLRAKDWTKIKLKWLEACHGNDDCNVYVFSIDKTVRDLNAIAEKMIRVGK